MKLLKKKHNACSSGIGRSSVRYGSASLCEVKDRKETSYAAGLSVVEDGDESDLRLMGVKT